MNIGALAGGLAQGYTFGEDIKDRRRGRAREDRQEERQTRLDQIAEEQRALDNRRAELRDSLLVSAESRTQEDHDRRVAALAELEEIVTKNQAEYDALVAEGGSSSSTSTGSTPAAEPATKTRGARPVARAADAAPAEGGMMSSTSAPSEGGMMSSSSQGSTSGTSTSPSPSAMTQAPILAGPATGGSAAAAISPRGPRPGLGYVENAITPRMAAPAAAEPAPTAQPAPATQAPVQPAGAAVPTSVQQALSPTAPRGASPAPAPAPAPAALAAPGGDAAPDPYAGRGSGGFHAPPWRRPDQQTRGVPLRGAQPLAAPPGQTAADPMEQALLQDAQRNGALAAPTGLAAPVSQGQTQGTPITERGFMPPPGQDNGTLQGRAGLAARQAAGLLLPPAPPLRGVRSGPPVTETYDALGNVTSAAPAAVAPSPAPTASPAPAAAPLPGVDPSTPSGKGVTDVIAPTVRGARPSNDPDVRVGQPVVQPPQAENPVTATPREGNEPIVREAAGSYMEYFMQTAAPEYQAALLKQGDIAGAQQLQGMIESAEYQEGLDAYARAAASAALGDIEGFADAAIDAFNNEGYFPDGWTVDKSETEWLTDSAGNVAGVRIGVQDADGNLEVMTFESMTDFTEVVLAAIAPEQAIERNFEKADAAAALAAETAAKAALAAQEAQIKAATPGDAVDVNEQRRKWYETISATQEGMQLTDAEIWQRVDQAMAGGGAAAAPAATGRPRIPS